jgi:hypothetical protein
MDALFGVTNIPSAIWIDERGTIVRPPELCTPPPVTRPDVQGSLQPHGRNELAAGVPRLVADGMRARSEDPQRYADRLRDWTRSGAQSHYALAADEVIARSRPRPIAVSQAAAHFELAQHLWHREGFSGRTLRHFEAAHTLQPDNITYRRQAYSAYSVGRNDGNEFSRLLQSPREGEDWPFVSDYNADMAALQAQLEREQAARQQPSAWRNRPPG